MWQNSINTGDIALSFKKIEKPYKPLLKWEKIRLLAFDCDGVLTDGRIIYDSEGKERKNFDARDGMGFLLLRQTDLIPSIITGRVSPALERRSVDLKIEHLYQGVANKLARTQELLAELKLDFENLLFMGDDWNDIPVMFRAAISVCPADAFPDIQRLSDHITTRPGGRGAVRECIEYVLANKRIHDPAVQSYLDQIS
jgi:3-deoxy-D-manno-octulosonate 8-phosphate phosphatase (KDO 8-P phosphatase)